jgi:hypothetical protein
VKVTAVIARRYNLQDEEFFRQVVFAEEDRRLFTTAPWHGGFRWFRSPNVVPIERWQRVEVASIGVSAIPRPIQLTTRERQP